MSLEGTDIYVDVDIKLHTAICDTSLDWFRLAIVSGFELYDDKKPIYGLDYAYVELDIWDSDFCDSWDENTEVIVDTVAYGGDTIEYKYDQIPIGKWKHYRINVSEWIRKAYGTDVAQTLLMQKVTFEFYRPTTINEIKVEVDDFWLSREQ